MILQFITLYLESGHIPSCHSIHHQDFEHPEIPLQMILSLMREMVWCLCISDLLANDRMPSTVHFGERPCATKRWPAVPFQKLRIPYKIANYSNVLNIG